MDSPPIVAVASYADDLEAVCELLSALPAACSLTVMVTQHLKADRESLVAEALAKRTGFPVTLARNGMVVEQDHVYLTVANATLTMTGRCIRMAPNVGQFDHPGDVLFASVAQERGVGSIGVVLSGGGSDGALGTQAIRHHGGTTFAQHPGSARFPTMPINAIETGRVDFVLRPNEIARGLASLSRHAAPASNVARSLLVAA